LVQGQIFVANHSLNCSFVLFPCTRMLVFNWTRTRSQWSNNRTIYTVLRRQRRWRVGMNGKGVNPSQKVAGRTPN
jgi:hypothetical protein